MKIFLHTKKLLVLQDVWQLEMAGYIRSANSRPTNLARPSQLSSSRETDWHESLYQ